jgi:signal transduction histidine kinase
VANQTSPKSLLRLFGVNLALIAIFGAAATAFVFRATWRVDETVRDARFRQEQSAEVHALVSGLTSLSVPQLEAVKQNPRAEQQRLTSATRRLANAVDKLLMEDNKRGAIGWGLPPDAVEALQTMQTRLIFEAKLLTNSTLIDENGAPTAALESVSWQSKQLSIQATSLDKSLEKEFLVSLKQHSEEANKMRRRGLFLGGAALLMGVLTALFGRRLVRSIQQSETQREADLAVIHEKAALLNYSNNKLGQSNRDLMGFAFVASHDLQEPLRKIVAFGDRLERRAVDTTNGTHLDDTSADYLKRMRSAASRMQQLIEDLLLYSRTATRGADVSEIDLNEVVAGVISDLEIAIEQAGATVTVDNLPRMQADPTQMRQLIQNLTSNALKFRKPDVAPTVQIKATKLTAADDVAGKLMAIHPTGKQWWRFEIVDNGIGFDQQYADKVFLVFQRLHGRDEYAGSGLGLAVARRIVERHSGEISATSIAGVGTSFSFVLPVAQPEPVEAPPSMIDRHNVDQATNVPLAGTRRDPSANGSQDHPLVTMSKPNSATDVTSTAKSDPDLDLVKASF